WSTSKTPSYTKSVSWHHHLDMNSKKITISHEAIPAVGWPAMTMRFTFVNADDAIDAINALKTGNHVDFSFIQQGNISLLKSINVTQS
ncbi:copper-binding protein, partial [Klebsiella pneumoniae]|uniref:copper-binding protein n=1 Tax=Klebsiella pneumoniae TaxID=573 RepID=UPI003314CA70